jgi:hypothetical protein
MAGDPDYAVVSTVHATDKGNERYPDCTAACRNQFPGKTGRPINGGQEGSQLCFVFNKAEKTWYAGEVEQAASAAGGRLRCGVRGFDPDFAIATDTEYFCPCTTEETCGPSGSCTDAFWVPIKDVKRCPAPNGCACRALYKNAWYLGWTKPGNKKCQLATDYNSKKKRQVLNSHSFFTYALPKDAPEPEPEKCTPPCKSRGERCDTTKSPPRCIATCAEACPPGQACDENATPPACKPPPSASYAFVTLDRSSDDSDSCLDACAALNTNGQTNWRPINGGNKDWVLCAALLNIPGMGSRWVAGRRKLWHDNCCSAAPFTLPPQQVRPQPEILQTVAKFGTVRCCPAPPITQSGPMNGYRAVAPLIWMLRGGS